MTEKRKKKLIQNQKDQKRMPIKMFVTVELSEENKLKAKKEKNTKKNSSNSMNSDRMNIIQSTDII